MNTLRIHALAASLTGCLTAQDMIAVTQDGRVVGLDSTAGTVVTVAAGIPMARGLARDGNGQLWTTAMFQNQPHLVRVDHGSGAMTPTRPLPYLPRSLAPAGGTRLFASLHNSLWQIDTATGAATSLLATGLGELGGILFHQGTLYGWDRLQGLVRLDPVTGLATDVNPAVGGIFNGHPIHWLSLRSDGEVVGAGEVLRFSINLSNGIAEFLGAIPADIRGATMGVATSYGTGCQGGAGPVQLQVVGAPWSPGWLTATSYGHGGAGGTSYPGVLMLGFSRSVHGGNALPFSLDPLLGTQGCALYASIDASVLGLTNQGTLQFPVSLPGGLGGLEFYLQHAVFEPVAGGMSWSQGIKVHLGR